MAENTIRIESSAANPVFTQPPTALTGLVYTTLVEDVTGVVAANNFLSVFNPVGSGKNLVIAQFVCFPYATAATSPTVNMDVQRISAASAGTQLAAANIGKFDTTQVNSVAEVRTLNPTVTLTGTVPIIAIPPAVTSSAAGASSTINLIPPSGSLFICRPGEGVVARTASGAVGQKWSLGFSWSEL